MRVCNHCGRLYDELVGGCPCRNSVKRVYARDSFYDRPAWRALSRYVRARDYEQDRLCMYLIKVGRPDSLCVLQRLYDYCIDVTGIARFRNDRLIVHHIVPREDNYSLQYEVDNLITVGNSVHEYIHQLYAHEKENVQDILRSAVRATLP